MAAKYLKDMVAHLKCSDNGAPGGLQRQWRRHSWIAWLLGALRAVLPAWSLIQCTLFEVEVIMVQATCCPK